MKCTKCGHNDTKVLESRLSHEGRRVRRRRCCQSCGHRYTTYEREEDFVFQIKKKDSRVEPYIREKAFKAIQIACRKRPITAEAIELLLGGIEKQIHEESMRTVPSSKLGDLILDKLLELDKVAYVRFASVYKDFQTPEEFGHTLKSLNE